MTQVQSAAHRQPVRRCRSGFTLLEVMIATAVTLLMMVSLTIIFKSIGDSVTQGRAALELNNRLRNVAMQLNTDFTKLTAAPLGEGPVSPGSATGYLEYYEGPLTDITASDVSPLLSRFGDVDDILMFTAKAHDRWFTGKVPRYILTGSAPSAGVNTDLVNISSQYAEIIVFAQPLVTNVGNPTRDPNFYLISSPNGAVAFEDIDNVDGTANGFPDSFNLHHRVLLIRPDLNLPAGVLPGSENATTGFTVAQPQSTGAITLPSPLCDMSGAHNQCDLSMRRVFNPTDGLSGQNDFLAANSLADLVNPGNRFAHIQVILPGTSSTTMPLLALGPGLGTTSPTVAPFVGDPLGNLGAGGFKVGTGFLHPAYTLRGSRGGEDVLATNILAFDAKGYDPAVPLLQNFGPDGLPGLAGIDDDGNGTTDDALNEFGWQGSDDQVLNPNDPGYAAAAVAGSGIAGVGEFVDLGWGRSTVLRMIEGNGGTLPALPAAIQLWTPLSGLANGSTTAFSDELFNSGLAITGTSGLHMYQPRFDTWTSQYESDGLLQAYRSGRTGVSLINGAPLLYGLGSADTTNALPAWRQTALDGARDGLDNNPAFGVGVDDSSEYETSAPFSHRMSGIRVSIRMEDGSTRQINQVSVGRELTDALD